MRLHEGHKSGSTLISTGSGLIQVQCEQTQTEGGNGREGSKLRQEQ